MSTTDHFESFLNAVNYCVNALDISREYYKHTQWPSVSDMPKCHVSYRDLLRENPEFSKTIYPNVKNWSVNVNISCDNNMLEKQLVFSIPTYNQYV